VEGVAPARQARQKRQYGNGLHGEGRSCTSSSRGLYVFRLFFGMPTSGDAAANPGGGGPLGRLLISVLGMVAVLLLFLLVANPDLELVGGKGRGLRGLAVCCAWRACTASASPWSRARPRPVQPMRMAIRPDGGPVGRSRSDWRSCQTLKPRRLQRPMRGSRACQQRSSLSSC